MKILHILSQIPDATGSGIYLQAAMRHAAERGFKNVLLAGVPIDSDHFGIPELNHNNYHPVRFEAEIPFPVVGMSDVMPYPSTRFCDLSADQLEIYLEQFRVRLSEAVERHQPDLIHSHHLWLLTSLAKQAYPDIPMVTSCHGSDLRQFHTCAHLQPLVLPGCRKVDRVCALSEVQKLEIEQLYRIDADRIEVIGAGYESRRFYRPGKPGTGSPLQILYAGKLSRSKGVPWLLKALQLLPHSDYIFHLVGDGQGEEKAEVLELAAQLGSRIQIHGKLNQDRLADLMRRCDLFVLPSFFEGLPLVLLEALACGCRILATALPGVSELFAGKAGGWVELVELPTMINIDTPHPADEGRFINNLLAALDKQCRALNRANGDAECPETLQQLLKDYTWEGIFTKLEKVYLDCLG